MKTICIKLIALVTILVTSSCRVHSTQEEFGPSRKQNVAVADYDEIDLSGGLLFDPFVDKAGSCILVYL